MVVSCQLVNAVTFEPVSAVNSVFFDEKNQQVFSVRSGGATGVLVRGFDASHCSNFRLEDQGAIVSIKLSPDQGILAIQRNKSTVRFINVLSLGPNGSLEASSEYGQSCRAKNATILGFYWSSSSEIIFLTSQGIEVHSVCHDRKIVKCLRYLNVQISWFVFCAKSSLLVVSSAVLAAPALNLFLIRPGSNILKLNKIEVEKRDLQERDVHVIKVYEGQVYVAIMIHPINAVSGGDGGDADVSPATTDVVLYRVSMDSSQVMRSHVLKAPFVGGGMAINVADNVLIVHHRTTGTSALFDVALNVETDGQVSYHHQPMLPLIKVEPSKSSMATMLRNSTSSPALSSSSMANDELLPQPLLHQQSTYSKNWITFLPDVIIDAKDGIMWKVKLRLDSGKCKQMSSNDLPGLVGFLQQREGGKITLMEVLYEWCSQPHPDLPSIGAAFNLISHQYRLFLDVQMQCNLGIPVLQSPFSSPLPSQLMRSQQAHPAPFTLGASATFLQNVFQSHASATQVCSSSHPAKVILDQADLYTNLFCPLMDLVQTCGSESPCQDGERLSPKTLTVLVMEYVRSLEEQAIPVQYFLNELIINLLVQQEAWYHLHQLLQYHVITDSKPLACVLLSLESVYPAAYQLAVDMLFRLKNSSDEICEILLSKGKVLSALKFLGARGLENTVSAEKFLHAAQSTGDDHTFYVTYCWLRDKQLLQRGCSQYSQSFASKFMKPQTPL